MAYDSPKRALITNLKKEDRKVSPASLAAFLMQNF